MAGRKEYEMLFQLNAELGRNFNNTFKAAQNGLASMQKEIQALNKTQSNIASYQKQQSAVEVTRQKLSLLQKQYDNIQKEIKETEGYSSSLENKLLSKKQQIDNTSSSLQRETQELYRTGAALKNAGIDTNKLTQESSRLSSQIIDLKQKQERAAESANEFSKTTEKLAQESSRLKGNISELSKTQEQASESADNFGTTAVQAFSAASQALIAAGIGAGLHKIYDAFHACKDASIEFESAITGVDKTTDLTNQELSDMASSIKELSTNIPATTTELSAVAEAGGQLGIAKEDLLHFTETMTMLGTATNLSAEEAATSLAKFANITKLAAEDYDNLGATVVELGNNFATTEADIVSMGMRLAAAGSLSGLSQPEIMGVATALSSLGIEAEAGGSAVSKLMKQFETMVATGATSLSDFAAIAGMSAEEFSVAWKNNAVEALSAFIGGLGKIQETGGSAIATLDDLGITEIRLSDAVLRMANSGGILAKSVSTANTAWEENIALTDEASKRYATTESQLVMRENAYNNLTIAVGDAYTPALRALYAAETQVLKGVTAFVEKNPVLVQTIGAVVGVIGTATAALTAYAAIAKVVKVLDLATLFTGPAGAAVIGITTVTAALTAMAGMMVAVISASKEADAEYEGLMLTSKRQYDALQDLNAEYAQLCEQSQENSVEAWELQRQIATLTEEYESNKRSVADLKQELSDLGKQMDESDEAYQKATNNINNELDSSNALISKLAELSSKTSLTASEQKFMGEIVDELNGRYAGLGLSVDNYSHKLSLSADAIRAMAKAQAEEKQWQTNYDKYVENLTHISEQKELVNELTDNATIAEKEYNAARASYDEKNAAITTSGWLGKKIDLYHNEGAAVKETKSAYEEYSSELENAEGYLSDLEAQQRELESALGLTADTMNGSVNGAMESTGAEAFRLTEQYQELYTAALESIAGQYSLWDQVKGATATSASSINSAIESQVDYWQKYNENLQKLGERSSEIAGLGEMLSSFADGSKESVNAVAGMAGATDDQLRTMVTNWQKLKKEQDSTADSISILARDFGTETNNMQESAKDAVQGMNLETEAKKAAEATIRGYISGAKGLKRDVITAFTLIGQAAAAALNSASRGGTSDSSNPKADHNATGTLHAKRGWSWVGERGPELMYLNGGEAIFPADLSREIAAANSFTPEDIQLVGLLPQMMDYLTARSVNASITATNAATPSNGMVLHVSPVYNISGVGNTSEMESVLHQHDVDLRDYILDVVAEAKNDRLRRDYL